MNRLWPSRCVDCGEPLGGGYRVSSVRCSECAPRDLAEALAKARRRAEKGQYAC